MSDDRLNAAPDAYLHAAAANSAPPPVLSDPLADGATPVEQLLRILGLAANSDDAGDMTASAEGYAQRDAWTTTAATAFPGQDGAAAGQIASGVAGALAAILAPLTQLPQQFTQGAQQMVRTAASLTGQDEPTDPITDPITDAVQDPGADAVDLDMAADPMTASPAPGVTAPSAALSPAVIPSPGTHPSAASATSAPARVQGNLTTATPAAPPVMTGMPLMPPAGLGNTGLSTTDSKTDTKRVAPPPVHNGAGVQGRMGVAGPVISTRIEDKPVAVRRAPAAEPR